MRLPRRFAVVLAALGAVLFGMPAQAASNRIFMSTNGNNASDCANPVTPCLTFAGALAQVNPGGEVIAEATGGYGPLNITQAVTISGPPGVVIYSGLQVNVNAPGALVVLRGLTIDGTGAAANGINVASVGTLFVESCVIANFASSDDTTGNGVVLPAGTLFVNDTVVRNNGGAAIIVGNNGLASITNVQLGNNQFGLIASGKATLASSVVAYSSGVGVNSETGEVNLERCVLTNNNYGITAGGLLGAIGTVRVSNSTITDNSVALSWLGGAILSRGDNTVEGNASGESFSGTYSPK